MTGTGWSLPARAKVNLVLRIVGRRPDGYHLLVTLFHALELHDDLWLAPAADGVRLRVTADRPELAVDPGPDNLVVRAITRFVAATGRRGGFDVHLHKRIPHGAGLGGGSSDAAAALRLANAACGDPLDLSALGKVAVALGADVPFFLRGGSQWGRGIGDELEPANVPARHFVLVVPPFGCPTADVYKNHAASWNAAAADGTVRDPTGRLTTDSALGYVFCNDLERAAERVRPALAALRRRIADLGHPQVAMTGSGSTLFLAFDTEGEARRCEDRLREIADEGSRLLRTRSADAGADLPTRAPRPAG